MHRSPEKRPELGAEDLRMPQTEPDAPQTQGGIFFFCKPEIIHLLVRTDIQRPDDHRLIRHATQDLPVCPELFFLTGGRRAVQKQKFAPEQPDSSRIVFVYGVQLGGALEIGKHPDAASVPGHVIKTPVLQQKRPVFFLLLLPPPQHPLLTAPSPARSLLPLLQPLPLWVKT